MMIEFILNSIPRKLNYEDLVNNIFPRFIKAFDAYTADIYDEKLIFRNYEEKKFANRRKIINRIYPVSFYDSILCELFFKRTPNKVISALDGQLYKAEPYYNGVILIADIKPFTMDESIDFENKLKSILKY